MDNSGKVTTKDRFLPCLLDRLIDDHPQVKKDEQFIYKVYSVKQLRKAILRDLVSLLNSKSKIPVTEFKNYDEVGRSVLNYGLEDICGKSFYSTSLATLEENIKQAIINFEPRISKESLSVKVRKANEDRTFSSFLVEIHGVINVYPLSEEIVLRSELDIETGNFHAEA